MSAAPIHALPGRPVRIVPRSLLGAAVAVAVVALLAVGNSGGTAAVAPHPAGPATVAPASSDWPSYMNGLTKHSSAPLETVITPRNVANLTQLWNFTTGGTIAAEPIIANGHVFIGSWDGSEYALNASNGTMLWKTYTGTSTCGRAGFAYGVTSAPTVLNGRVYFGGGGQYWIAASVAKGKVLWSVYTGNNTPTAPLGGHYNWASPLIWKGNAYVGIASACGVPQVVGALWEINLTTHLVTHVFNTTNLSQLGASVWGSPSLDASKGIVYISTGNLFSRINNMSLFDDSLIAFNASTLQVVGHFHVPWAYEIPDGDFGTTPSLFTTDKGVPLVGGVNKDGIFWAVHRTNMSRIAWFLPVSTSASNAPAAVNGDTIYLGANQGNITGMHSPNGTQLNATHANGTLWSVNTTTGKPNWVVAMPGAVFSAPVYFNGMVAVTGGKELLVVNATTGATLFSWFAPKGFYGGPAVTQGRLYVGNNNGVLTAFALYNATTGNWSGGNGVRLGAISMLVPLAGTTAIAAPRIRRSDD